MPNHHIEQSILRQLAYSGRASFSQLKPDDIMNNAFDYHLKALIRDKLVAKNDGNYQLTAAGLEYIDKLSFKTGKPRSQPKLVAILALQNSRGQWLMAERKVEPYLGQLMLPSGKQHYGESPANHIIRELDEQVGQAVAVERRGFADVRISRDGHLVSHVAGHVYAGKFDGPAPAANNKFSYSFLAADAANLLAGTLEIIKQLEAGGDFFLPLDVTCK